MTHEIRVLVASEEFCSRLSEAGPEVQPEPATSGWWIVPLTPECARALSGASLSVPDLEDPTDRELLSQAVAPLVASLTSLRLTGGVAGLFTQYFGGSGDQASFAVRDGVVVVEPVVGPGSINAALQAIGVAADGEQDEFDTIGLHRWRMMDHF